MFLNNQAINILRTWCFIHAVYFSIVCQLELIKYRPHFRKITLLTYLYNYFWALRTKSINTGILKRFTKLIVFILHDWSLGKELILLQIFFSLMLNVNFHLRGIDWQPSPFSLINVIISMFIFLALGTHFMH